MELNFDKYYRPESLNFLAVDSLVLARSDSRTSPILLMLQMTRAREIHETKMGGLEMVDAMRFPPGAKKYYVVVTPEMVRPKITIPIKYFKRCKQDTDYDKKLKVFHCPIRFDELFPQNRP